MTEEKFDNMMRSWLAAQAEKPCPDWAKAELQEAIDAGITDGARPCELVPRYQAAIMAKRAAKG